VYLINPHVSDLRLDNRKAFEYPKKSVMSRPYVLLLLFLNIIKAGPITVAYHITMDAECHLSVG
jgi:hypothetical protein